MNVSVKTSKKLKDFFNLLWKCILQLFFPKKCPFCRDIIRWNEHYCSNCYGSLAVYENNNLSFEGLDNLLCCFSYLGNIQSAIWEFKFRSHPEYAEMFAKLTMDILGVRLKDFEFDLVLYVPMHPKKQKLRGYNQAELLAKELAKQLDIPFGQGIIKKIKNNSTQHELSAIERHKNVQGVYSVIKPGSVRGKRILLLDDVFTTGATLCECGKCLHCENADWVCGLTIARAVIQYDDDDDDNDGKNKNTEKEVKSANAQILEDGDCEIADLLCGFQSNLDLDDKAIVKTKKESSELTSTNDFKKYLLEEGFHSDIY